MRRKTFWLATAVALAFPILGCRVSEHVDQWDHVDSAVAVLHPTEGNDVRGVVEFHEIETGVRVTAIVEGLEPGSTHAIHVHEFGDVRAPDATSAGGHYNPEGHAHGLPADDADRHAGDLGNLEADDEGEAHHEIVVRNLSVADLKNPVIGRAVIVHEKRDTGAQPTGAAGARIAFGVIGAAESGTRVSRR